MTSNISNNYSFAILPFPIENNPNFFNPIAFEDNYKVLNKYFSDEPLDYDSINEEKWKKLKIKAEEWKTIDRSQDYVMRTAIIHPILDSLIEFVEYNIIYLKYYEYPIDNMKQNWIRSMMLNDWIMKKIDTIFPFVLDETLRPILQRGDIKFRAYFANAEDYKKKLAIFSRKMSEYSNLALKKNITTRSDIEQHYTLDTTQMNLAATLDKENVKILQTNFR